MQIKSWFDRRVLFEVELPTIRLTLEAAIKAHADLTDASLTHASLTHADLTRADLIHADLTHADLTGADLTRANLTHANLTHANLTGADLTQIRDDIWAVLSAAPREVAALREALVAGKVNGSCYSGECACLLGTIANARHCDVEALGNLRPNLDRAAERFFMAISPGHTPENHAACKIVVEWIDEWVENVKGAFAPVSVQA